MQTTIRITVPSADERTLINTLTPDERTAALIQAATIKMRGITMSIGTFGQTQIWQHSTSGEWFLVRLNSAGEITETNGPLPRADAEYTVNEAGGLFDGTSEDNDWFTERHDEFRVVYP
jgi:hypothetical protein